MISRVQSTSFTQGPQQAVRRKKCGHLGSREECAQKLTYRKGRKKAAPRTHAWRRSGTAAEPGRHEVDVFEGEPNLRAEPAAVAITCRASVAGSGFYSSCRARHGSAFSFWAPSSGQHLPCKTSAQPSCTSTCGLLQGRSREPSASQRAKQQYCCQRNEQGIGKLHLVQSC